MSDYEIVRSSCDLPDESVPLASSSYIEKDKSVDATDGKGDGGEAAVKSFPLLLLPIELVSFILRLLPLADRLRARVNRMLFELEAKDQYAIKEMVVECSANGHRWAIEDQGIRMNLDGPRGDYAEALGKLASNVVLHSLAVNCASPTDRVLIPHVKEFNAEQLKVVITSEEGMDREEITDGSLEEWIGDRKFLTIHSEGGSITGDRLHRLFVEMEGGHSSLLSLQLDYLKPDMCRRLLELVGISYANNRFHSTRRNVEVYVKKRLLCASILVNHFLIIVGSKMKIALNQDMLTGAPDMTEGRSDLSDLESLLDPAEFSMERHNEDGTVPHQWHGLYSFYLPIADIRNSDQFRRLTVTYSV